MLVLLAVTLAACTPSQPTLPPTPTRPTVVGQPAPAEVRDLGPYLKFPCNLVAPGAVGEFRLKEIAATPPDPQVPGEEGDCVAQMSRDDPGETEDDVVITPFDRDIVAEEEDRVAGLTPVPPVAGLPAGLRKNPGPDECSVYVRTAQDQGLRASLTRYEPDRPGAASSCDTVVRLAGAVLGFVPRTRQ
ncbi:DUF3558 family protein [Actinomycetospora rhizophila]|uniref:DUF3558 family protein n=1 Tax=Actinomycetospora rhizophila TaxID=1416876 RepID=A0ABV9ZMZ8_9PSEU